MKLSHLPLLLAATALLAADGAEKRIEWPGISRPMLIPAEKSQRSAGPAAPYRFDGETKLAFPFRERNAFTVRAQLRFPEKFRGTVLSFHTPRDGRRGIEIGFSGGRFFQLDGDRFAGQISAGKRDTIVSFVDPESAPMLCPGTVYDFIVRFEPERALRLLVADPQQKRVLLRRTLPCPKVSQLAAEAGNGRLAFGGRIGVPAAEQFPVPPGTELCKVTAWRGALNDAELSTELGYPVHREQPLAPGASWNESISYRDPLSGLTVRQLTTEGLYNQGPTVHPLTAFAGGSETVIFATVRQGRSAVMSGDLRSGRITAHFLCGKLPTYDEINPRNWPKSRARYEGINLAASPHHRKVALISAGTLHLIDLDTHQATAIVKPESDPSRWMTTPVFAADGKSLAFPAGVKGIAPNDFSRNPITYFHCTPDGKLTKLYFHPWGQTHIFPNPVDPDLWIIKCGRPAFRSPEREPVLRQPDCFILNSRTGKLTPLLPRNGYKNITHLAWNHRGDRIVYHGSAAGGGGFMGAMCNDGKTVLWEHLFPQWSHRRNGLNHIAADTVDDLIFDDGMAVPGQLSLIDYRNAGQEGKPRILPVARWRNQWNVLPGQLTHPHPAVSPDGRTLVFYGCRDSRVHLYAVDLTPLREKLKAERPAASAGQQRDQF